MRFTFAIFHSPFAILLIAGCTSAVQSGHNTALDSADLVRMTDDMAMKIVADPQVQAAMTRDGKLAVVVQPVENRMRGEVLPRGEAEAFTARLRVLLARHAPDRFVWIMNKREFYNLRGRELDLDLGPDPERIEPKYALTATFSSLADEDPVRRSSYYLCNFQLTNLADGAELWTGSYEVKKIATKGFLD
jgi:hypothetical protein